MARWVARYKYNFRLKYWPARIQVVRKIILNGFGVSFCQTGRSRKAPERVPVRTSHATEFFSLRSKHWHGINLADFLKSELKRVRSPDLMLFHRTTDLHRSNCLVSFWRRVGACLVWSAMAYRHSSSNLREFDSGRLFYLIEMWLGWFNWESDLNYGRRFVVWISVYFPLKYL